MRVTIVRHASISHSRDPAFHSRRLSVAATSSVRGASSLTAVRVSLLDTSLPAITQNNYEKANFVMKEETIMEV